MWSYTPGREPVCIQRCRLRLLLFDPNTKALNGECPWSPRFNNRRGACLVLFLHIKVVATKFGVTLELTQVTPGGCRFILMRRHRLNHTCTANLWRVSTMYLSICLVPTRLDGTLAECRWDEVTNPSTHSNWRDRTRSLLGTDEAKATYTRLY
jgi:hypothetical protein